MDENNKCQIQRIGTVISLDENSAVLEIEGKPIQVPRHKVAADIKLGDQVSWRGGHWENKEE